MKIWRKQLLVRSVAIAALFAGLLTAERVKAEALFEVLGTAYLNNPTLRSERARLRATDEGVPQALSGYRPTVTATGNGGFVDEETRFDTSSTFIGGGTDTGAGTGTGFGGGSGGRVADQRTTHGYSVTLSQPVFRGFRTVNSVKQAESNVLAGRESLLDIQQRILLAAATAFLNVVRDQSIVQLRINNVEVLSEQQRASDARFEVGEVTRTDVAQARARRQGSISDLAVARANLANSRAEFQRIVGRKPGTLREPKSMQPYLPPTLDQAIRIAQNQNPQLLNAFYSEEAARHAVGVAKGDLLPEVSLEAQYNRDFDPSRTVTDAEDARIMGRVSIPLYQGGGVYSQVRQAKQTASQFRLQTLEVERQVRADVINAWEALLAARGQIDAAREQVKANDLAFRGVTQEAEVGSRTTLDVLDAEQELLDSRVALVTARRDEFVAGFQLLASVGKMTARDLKLSVPYYDPTKHYDDVRNKLFGVSVGGGERDHDH